MRKRKKMGRCKKTRKTLRLKKPHLKHGWSRRHFSGIYCSVTGMLPKQQVACPRNTEINSNFISVEFLKLLRIYAGLAFNGLSGPVIFYVKEQSTIF